MSTAIEASVKSLVPRADATLAKLKQLPAPSGTDPLLTIQEVCRVVGVTRASIYDWMHRGTFPRPLRIGLRRVAWRTSVIEAWMASRSVGGGSLHS